MSSGIPKVRAIRFPVPPGRIPTGGPPIPASAPTTSMAVPSPPSVNTASYEAASVVAGRALTRMGRNHRIAPYARARRECPECGLLEVGAAARRRVDHEERTRESPPPASGRLGGWCDQRPPDFDRVRGGASSSTAGARFGPGLSAAIQNVQVWKSRGPAAAGTSGSSGSSVPPYSERLVSRLGARGQRQIASSVAARPEHRSARWR